MTEVIIENKLQCGEVKQVSVNDNNDNLERLRIQSTCMKRRRQRMRTNENVSEAGDGGFASGAFTVESHGCKFVALKHWLDAKLDTEFSLPIKDNFLTRTKVRLMRLASRLRYFQLHAPNVVKDMLAWGLFGQSLLMKIVPTMERILLDEPTTTWQDVQAFITREIAKRDSSQVEGMVEVKEAVGTSETGLGRPEIQTIYYQVLGQGPVKAASVDRFEAGALLEALDRGSDGNLAEAAAVVKSQWRVFARRMMPRGLDCSPPTTGPRSQVKRTLSTAGLQFYHPATIHFVDGTGLTGGKSAYRSISFLPQQFIRYVNSSRSANATYRFFHIGVMVRSMSQHLVKSGLTQETLESILCQKERVSLAGKLLENQTWRRNYIRLPEELMNLRRKETILEAAVSATDSMKSVRLTRANSLSTSASSSSDVARPMTAPSSSSASSSSRVGRQKTAPSSTNASSFSKASPQKKAPSSTIASFFSKVALQKKAASSRTSTSVPDNLSQEKRADILSQPWLCDQKTLLISMLTKYPFFDKKIQSWGCAA
eukprot:g76807.t1